ncbi:MAG TPA: hypothetical protein VGB79_04885 [Allosphingosinicella sp.]|jgi:hypothetical protein
MSETDRSKLTGYSEGAEIEHDEFHSSLEMDDTSGWRIFIVPGLAIAFLIGAVILFLVSTGDTTPDPRVQAQIRAKQEQQAQRKAQADAAARAAMSQPLPADPAETTNTQ